MKLTRGKSEISQENETVTFHEKNSKFNILHSYIKMYGNEECFKQIGLMMERFLYSKHVVLLLLYLRLSIHPGWIRFTCFIK